MKTNIPQLSIIVAVDSAGGFAKNGKIPWTISEDMKHFKETTMGGVCIMGRRTYEDMFAMNKPKKKKLFKKELVKEILPGRKSIVITSDPKYKPHSATAALSIRNAIETLEDFDRREIFIIGGYRMFIEALPYTNKIYLTIIKSKSYQCDRFFPIEILNKQYKIVKGKETEKLYFLTYNKR